MSKPLKEVKEPAALRDYILSEWKEFRAKRFPGAPAELHYTSSVGDGNDSPSHKRGSAIDIVTDDWAHRRYLFPFGLWLRGRNSSVNVIYYPRNNQPHLHVAVWSGFTSRADNSIAFAEPGGKYTVYQPKDIQGKAKEIRAKMENMANGYLPLPAGQTIDWDALERELGGTQDIQESINPGGGARRFWDTVKRYWWIGGISVLALVVVLIIKRRNNDESED